MGPADIEIDGSLHSGSGTIVRQAVGFAALTGRSIHVVNARARRADPGLKPQHIRVIQAIGELVHGTVEGATPGSREFWFTPGTLQAVGRYVWDIGTAGSTTMLAIAVLPALAFVSSPIAIEIRGGLFQDFAPSFFHLQSVLVPLLDQMGFTTEIAMDRPGYVPKEPACFVFRLSR